MVVGKKFLGRSHEGPEGDSGPERPAEGAHWGIKIFDRGAHPTRKILILLPPGPIEANNR